MKKVLCIVLSLILLFTVTACGQPDTQETTKYVPNTQAEVAVAFVYNGKANVATRPLDDAKLKSITLACVYYDITGKQIGSRKLIDCDIENPKNVTLWQTDCPELAVYMDSVVYSTTDESGVTLTAEGIDIWESSTVAAFQIDTYRKNLEKRIGDEAALALTNSYVKIGAVSWEDLAVTVDMEFLSEDMKSVYLFALWFDADGQPVDIQACGYCANGEIMVAHTDSGGKHSYVFQAPENAQSAKLAVHSVDLQDGTTWHNPFIYEWIVLNQSNAK